MEHTPPKSSPRDVFLYLLAIITLYISIWRFIDLWFGYINELFPDQFPVWGASEDIRLSVATLLVVFPVYIGLTWFLRKDAIAHPEKREIRVRKWLLNFTLFLAAITIIADLVTLVNNFLNGELTTRFVLKVFIVLLVAGAVFAYYFWDLRRETLPSSKPSTVLATLTSVIILGSIIGGFFIIGSPVTQRKVRLDRERTANLQTLQSQIINFWQQKKRLPQGLEELKNDISGFVPPNDPVTAQPYEYRVTGDLAFELCATFDIASRAGDKYPEYGPHSTYGANWDHDEGRTCFSRTIDPELYTLKGGIIPRPAY